MISCKESFVSCKESFVSCKESSTLFNSKATSPCSLLLACTDACCKKLQTIRTPIAPGCPTRSWLCSKFSWQHDLTCTAGTTKLVAQPFALQLKYRCLMDAQSWRLVYDRKFVSKRWQKSDAARQGSSDTNYNAYSYSYTLIGVTDKQQDVQN